MMTTQEIHESIAHLSVFYPVTLDFPTGGYAAGEPPRGVTLNAQDSAERALLEIVARPCPGDHPPGDGPLVGRVSTRTHRGYAVTCTACGRTAATKMSRGAAIAAWNLRLPRWLG